MKYCNQPFIHAEISSNGVVRLCCGGWHPKIVGNIHDNTLEEIWINNESKKVRDSIDDQSYKYCKLDICPAVFKPTPFKPTPFEPDKKPEKTPKVDPKPESCLLYTSPSPRDS